MSVRRLLVVLATVLSTAAAVVSTSQLWFTEDLYPATHGYETTWGKSLIALAILGALSALAGPLFVRRLWVFDLLIGVAGLGMVIAAVATHHAQFVGDAWLVTAWYWAALAATICWSIAAATGALVARRREVSVVRWLWVSLRRDVNPPYTRVTLAFIAASASALLLFVGVFGPWQATPVYSASGLDNSQDGMLVLGAAFMALLGLLSYWRLGSRRALLAVVVLAVAAGIVSIWDLHDIGKRSDVLSGWGVNLAAEASVGLAVFAVRLFARARSLITPSPVVERTAVEADSTEPMLGP